jgi:RHS repeat-associated protein
MKVRILLSVALAMLCWAAPSMAAVRAGVTTYRVQLVLYPGDDGAAVAKRLAAMYRGTVETAVDGDGSFTIALSPATADLMGRDPAVEHLELAETTPAPMVTTAAALETTAVATPWKLGDYQYDGSGNIRRIGADLYAYDHRNRLVLSADASQSPLVPKQSYTYDNFGNMTSVSTTGTGLTTMGVDTSSNRVTAVTAAGASTTTGYDQAGNMTRYGTATYTYDALNMLTRSTFGGLTRYYVYSASDERIYSLNEGATITRVAAVGHRHRHVVHRRDHDRDRDQHVRVRSPVVRLVGERVAGGLAAVVRGTIEVSAAGMRSEWTIRDAAGQVLRRFSKESTGEWKWQEDYVYRGAQMLAAEVPDSTKTHHFHLDHLGTPRLITGNGGVELSRHNYHPFGMEMASTSSTAAAREKKQFTGHERDAESLDYMHARFYAPYMGRFLSVDPMPGRQREPQSWNRYTYALNNPLKYTDPDGRYVTNCASGDKQCNADAAAFETARQNDLKSKDVAVAAAAGAYGNPGDANGITVGFGTSGKDGGTTTAQLQGNTDGTMGMIATVMIKSGLSGTDLNAAIAHEGQHVLDAQGFVNTFTKNGAFWDTSKNLTSFQTEMNAYRLTHSVFGAAKQTFSTRCTGCTLGGTKPLTPADRDLAIRKILADPRGAYNVTPQNQGPRQFPEWTTPP